MEKTWLLDAVGQRARLGIGFRRQHRQRRLEEMRQVGDMGAGAAHHFLAVLDQGVELAGQRRDLGGEFAFQPPRLAVADARQRLADTRRSGSRPIAPAPGWRRSAPGPAAGTTRTGWC